MCVSKRQAAGGLGFKRNTPTYPQWLDIIGDVPSHPHFFYNRVNSAVLTSNQKISILTFDICSSFWKHCCSCWLTCFCLFWCSQSTAMEGAQWFSGRVLDSRRRGRGFEPHWLPCGVSLCKTHLSLPRTGSTQEDPSGQNWKIVDWDVKNQIKQTKSTSIVISRRSVT